MRLQIYCPHRNSPILNFCSLLYGQDIHRNDGFMLNNASKMFGSWALWFHLRQLTGKSRSVIDALLSLVLSENVGEYVIHGNEQRMPTSENVCWSVWCSVRVCICR